MSCFYCLSAPLETLNRSTLAGGACRKASLRAAGTTSVLEEGAVKSGARCSSSQDQICCGCKPSTVETWHPHAHPS